jgi:TetR/AcrR family transcriptional repressor of nem operon
LPDDALFSKTLDDAISRKHRNARRDAIHTLSSIVGAIVLARAVDDPELSEEILREVRAALD